MNDEQANEEQALAALMPAYERMIAALDEHDTVLDKARLVASITAYFLCQVEDPASGLKSITQVVRKIMSNQKTADFCGRPLHVIKLTK